MVIEGEFYRLKPVHAHSTKFDLELLHNISGKNPRQEFKHAAYGISLEYAVKKLIVYSINNKYKDETLSLRQYLEEYKQFAEKFKEEFPVKD